MALNRYQVTIAGAPTPCYVDAFTAADAITEVEIVTGAKPLSIHGLEFGRPELPHLLNVWHVQMGQPFLVDLPPESCGTCRFGELGEKPSEWGRVVACRRYPPQVVAIDNQPRNANCMSLESGWCGEYRRGTPHLGRGDMWQVAKNNLKREPVQ